MSLHPIAISAQCPSFINSTFNAGCIGAGSPCILCTDQTITLHAIGINLPNPGCIKWYYSQTAGFNPYNNEGTLIGCGAIAGNTCGQFVKSNGSIIPTIKKVPLLHIASVVLNVTLAELFPAIAPHPIKVPSLL